MQIFNDNTIGTTSYKVVTRRNNSPLDKSLADLGDIARIAVKYGINKEAFLELIECESGFRNYVYGDGGRAFGLLQFHFPTFSRYCNGNYFDSNDQLECAGQMISKGLGHHWTCSPLPFLNIYAAH